MSKYLNKKLNFEERAILKEDILTECYLMIPVRIRKYKVDASQKDDMIQHIALKLVERYDSFIPKDTFWGCLINTIDQEAKKFLITQMKMPVCSSSTASLAKKVVAAMEDEGLSIEQAMERFKIVRKNTIVNYININNCKKSYSLDAEYDDDLSLHEKVYKKEDEKSSFNFSANKIALNISADCAMESEKIAFILNAIAKCIKDDEKYNWRPLVIKICRKKGITAADISRVLKVTRTKGKKCME